MSLFKQMQLLQYFRFIFKRVNWIRVDFLHNLCFFLFNLWCLRPAHHLAILCQRILACAHRRYRRWYCTHRGCSRFTAVFSSMLQGSKFECLSPSHHEFFVLSPKRLRPLILNAGGACSILDLDERVFAQNLQESIQLLLLHSDVWTLTVLKCCDIVWLVVHHYHSDLSLSLYADFIEIV